jgi:hypothetical protein
MSQEARSPAAKAPPTLVEVLLQIRNDMRAHPSPPYLYLGIPNAGRLRCFTGGYWHCTYHLATGSWTAPPSSAPDASLTPGRESPGKRPPAAA